MLVIIRHVLGILDGVFPALHSYCSSDERCYTGRVNKHVETKKIQEWCMPRFLGCGLVYAAVLYRLCFHVETDIKFSLNLN